MPKNHEGIFIVNNKKFKVTKRYIQAKTDDTLWEHNDNEVPTLCEEIIEDKIEISIKE